MFGPVRALIALAVAFTGASVCAEPLIVEGLARQASLGFRTEAAPGGLTVSALDVASAAASAKLADGDVITAVNGKTFAKPYIGQALLGALRGGTPVELAVTRASTRAIVRFTPSARPLEQIPGVETQYGSVRVSDGTRLRTLIARRTGLEGSLPPLLFTQWVSCGTLEYRAGSNSRELLARFARDSGMALVRVERVGSSDSEGPPCHELDHDTEIAHYIDAFDQLLRANPGFDREHIVVMGSSLGSTTAPLVARGLEQRSHRIAGVTINGGGAVTYFERMLNFDRAYLERRPDAVRPADINPGLEQRILFQVEYLLKGRSPDEVAKDNAAMQAVRADTLGLGDGEHYGRPYAYHQQAARKNFLEAWTSLKDARVLALYGEYDQYEARHGHEIIATLVNRVRPGSAEFVELAKLDHDSDMYPTTEAAYASSGRGVSAIEVHIETVNRWLWTRVGVKPPG